MTDADIFERRSPARGAPSEARTPIAFCEGSVRLDNGDLRRNLCRFEEFD